MLILIPEFLLREKMGRHIKHGQESFRVPKPIPLDFIVSYRPYSLGGSCRYVQISPVSEFLWKRLL